MVTRIVERHFQAKGWDVESVHDGSDALTSAEATTYDLIVLDRFLPTMLGDEVLQALRERGDTTPVVMISGVDDEAAVVRAFELGANDFLHKPIDTQEMEARATVHLATARRSGSRRG